MTTTTDAQPIVRPDVRSFLDMLNATPLATIETLGVEQARAITAQMRPKRAVPLHDLAVVRDLSAPGPAGPIPLRFYDRRSERTAGPLLVYFHGGGFVLGNLDSHDDNCVRIAWHLDLPVVAVEYRLAPEHPWPAAPADCEATVRWLAGAGAAALARSFTSLTLVGDSAGANLAAVVAGCLVDGPAPLPVVGQCLLYPSIGTDQSTASRAAFSDGYLLTEASIVWFKECYAADCGDGRYNLLARDLAKMPPTLLVTAGLDPLRDEGRDYAAALIHAGVSVIYRDAPGLIHGFFGMADAIPSAAADIGDTLDALAFLIGCRAGKPVSRSA